jgi:hypothetical protein
MQNVILFYTLQTNKSAAELQVYAVIQNALPALYKSECAYTFYKKVLDSESGQFEIEDVEVYDYLDALEIVSTFAQSGNLNKANFDALYKKHITDADLFLDKVIISNDYSAIRGVAGAYREGKIHFSWFSVYLCASVFAIFSLVIYIIRYPSDSKKQYDRVIEDEKNGARTYAVRVSPLCSEDE